MEGRGASSAAHKLSALLIKTFARCRRKAIALIIDKTLCRVIFTIISCLLMGVTNSILGICLIASAETSPLRPPRSDKISQDS